MQTNSANFSLLSGRGRIAILMAEVMALLCCAPLPSLLLFASSLMSSTAEQKIPPKGRRFTLWITRRRVRRRQFEFWHETEIAFPPMGLTELGSILTPIHPLRFRRRRNPEVGATRCSIKGGGIQEIAASPFPRGAVPTPCFLFSLRGVICHFSVGNCSRLSIQVTQRESPMSLYS